ncbi:probable protein S-acyltransferase 7 [Argentina anserina]|uniref:probable protein S-acyltransferase 7 n=1 Tax=Argentina anserina TaxID=57926 RepID=UPI002176321F|nr:probable protein S-acyltransferase 7 [Potentilla anserina]
MRKHDDNDMVRTPDGMYVHAHHSSSDRRIMDTPGPSLRVYQVWKGNNRFFFGGRLIFGPDAKSLILTMLLIVVPVILFCAFVTSGLVHVFPHRIGNCIVAIAVVFAVYVVSLLLITASRDPGIIPRSLHPPEPEDDGYMSSMSSEWPGSQNGPPTVPPTKDVMVNGSIVKVKYCHTCMLYRPPRCSHCSICNNCVERFDHHCPWVGQCIGRRNYRFFFMFVVSTAMLCLYVFAFSWVNIMKIMDTYHDNLWRALLKSPVSGILIVYTFGAAWFVGGLTSFHLYLICTNQTTYENFRYRYAIKMNPHNRGCFENIAEVFCSRIPPSKHNFREKVKVDSSSVYPMSPEMPKTRYDTEMGKRQAVAAEDLEDLHSQIETVVGFDTLERCGTQPRHSNWDQKANWPASPDIQMLAAEFGMSDGSTTSRQKIEGPNDLH